MFEFIQIILDFFNDTLVQIRPFFIWISHSIIWLYGIILWIGIGKFSVACGLIALYFMVRKEFSPKK